MKSTVPDATTRTCCTKSSDRFTTSKPTTRLIREAAVPDEIDRARNFDTLRKNYRTRREFKNTEVKLQNASDSLRRKVKAMGFKGS